MSPLLPPQPAGSLAVEEVSGPLPDRRPWSCAPADRRVRPPARPGARRACASAYSHVPPRVTAAAGLAVKRQSPSIFLTCTPQSHSGIIRPHAHGFGTATPHLAGNVPVRTCLRPAFPDYRTKQNNYTRSSIHAQRCGTAGFSRPRAQPASYSGAPAAREPPTSPSAPSVSASAPNAPADGPPGTLPRAGRPAPRAARSWA